MTAQPTGRAGAVPPPRPGGTGRRRVLVAGIGNVFLGDDAFGIEVVRRLEGVALPDGVDVVDYGIRGVHLAYDILDGPYATLVLLDAVPLGDSPPGTVVVLEVDPAPPASGGEPAADGLDAHGLDPQAVLTLLRNLDAHVDRVLVVGCQPASLGEGMGLSGPVAQVVGTAARLVVDLARDEVAALAAKGRTTR